MDFISVKSFEVDKIGGLVSVGHNLSFSASIQYAVDPCCGLNGEV